MSTSTLPAVPTMLPVCSSTGRVDVDGPITPEVFFLGGILMTMLKHQHARSRRSSSYACRMGPEKSLSLRHRFGPPFIWLRGLPQWRCDGGLRCNAATVKPLLPWLGV